MFLGLDVFSGMLAMTPNYQNISNVNTVKINEGKYNRLYLTTDSNENGIEISDNWTYGTRINANYEDRLDGGNSSFSLQNTDTVVIKIREKGTLDWQTIYVVPINKIEDFNFIKEYDFASNSTPYEIMVSSFLAGNENASFITEITSNFRGICITDGEVLYSTDLNVDPITITQNNSNSVLPLLNSKYPIVVSNDESNYSSGSVNALFMLFDSACEPITGVSGQKYRKQIMDWLLNKKAKVLKLGDGTSKLIRVTGSPSIIDTEHPELKNISFDWVEVGDINSEEDMYNNLLSDVEPNKW